TYKDAQIDCPPIAQLAQLRRALRIMRFRCAFRDGSGKPEVIKLRGALLGALLGASILGRTSCGAGSPLLRKI
ncbi:hypothetical protein AAVH_43422, partial [Aphelenchoides avenae]